MKFNSFRIGRVLVVAALALWGAYYFAVSTGLIKVIEEVQPAAPKLDLLQDDRVTDKHPAFDSDLVDSRPLEWGGQKWQVNASAAVIELDIEGTPEGEAVLDRLYPSYAEAARQLRQSGFTILPSINCLDGKAKQFDDGLMAAVVSATASAAAPRDDQTPALLQRLLKKLTPGSEAHAWVFAALDLGGGLSSAERAQPPASAAAFRRQFERDPDAKPLGFYTWSADLERLWRFYKFLQQPLDTPQTKPVAVSLRQALADDEALRRDYRRLLDFLARVSNPPQEKSLLEPQGRHFLSPTGTREDALFQRLFGQTGAPEGVELMQEFVKAIRSGRVDLKPRKESGWYDYQVYALDTFLLPERGPEHAKLLLTKKYKQRLLEAFKSSVTKRRETQALFMLAAKLEAPFPSEMACPRLRLEPNPTYFLRMARSYGFIETALPAFFPPEVARALVGLREGGPRTQPLAQELAAMKQLFYGFHLVACEDIGLKPDLLADELPDQAAAKTTAEQFLSRWEQDSDLAVDTRVSIPIWRQPTGFPGRERWRLWCVLGVKGLKLKASYAVAPQVRAYDSKENWQDLLMKGSASHSVLLTDEFAEVNTSGPLNRAELRRVCDRKQTKEKIVKALAK